MDFKVGDIVVCCTANPKNIYYNKKARIIEILPNGFEPYPYQLAMLDSWGYNTNGPGIYSDAASIILEETYQNQKTIKNLLGIENT